MDVCHIIAFVGEDFDLAGSETGTGPGIWGERGQYRHLPRRILCRLTNFEDPGEGLE
jgi:hypothetical protein